MKKHTGWTGERLETFITNETMLEHLHRYAIALDFVTGKRILDIACGEGYGVNLIAKQALHVTGVDNDETTIEKAKTKYTERNITFKSGSVINIPAENGSFDIIICYETLEHVTDHDKMLGELKRVLVPGGLLFISTPEKLNYSDIPGYKNPFHQRELYSEEFKALLNRFFNHTSFFSQSTFTGSVLQNEKNQGPEIIYTGDYSDIKQSTDTSFMYWLAIASDQKLPSFPCSTFVHPKKISQLLFEETEAIKKTMTYQAGKVLLAPLKFIYSLIRK